MPNADSGFLLKGYMHYPCLLPDSLNVSLLFFFLKNRFHLDSIKVILPNQHGYISALFLLKSLSNNQYREPSHVEMLISLVFPISYLASYFSFFFAGLTSVLSFKFIHSAVYLTFVFTWIFYRYLKLTTFKKEVSDFNPPYFFLNPPFS